MKIANVVIPYKKGGNFSLSFIVLYISILYRFLVCLFYQIWILEGLYLENDIEPHIFQAIKALFPPDCNPFYAGFGNRDTDEISYLKVGIPIGKIFIINPKVHIEVILRHAIKL